MTSQKPSIASFMLGVGPLLATSVAWSADKLESTNPAGWSQQAQIQVAAQHDHGARAGLSSLSAIKPGPEASLFGSEAPAGSTSRVVDVAPGLKYVNVDSGETVTFKSGASEITFAFAQLDRNKAVALNVLFPELPGGQGVWVYIEQSRLYIGG
uniref:CopH protein n=1 Tax=Cupriavidus metallidurans TaxID=119219 RepID=Q9F3R5_9BURK|nr:CopH protein [Cupriavidus metallidurans CH34]